MLTTVGTSLTAGVCSIRVFYGYIDKRIELDLHTEDTVYLGVVKTSVIYSNNSVIYLMGGLSLTLKLTLFDFNNKIHGKNKHEMNYQAQNDYIP